MRRIYVAFLLCFAVLQAYSQANVKVSGTITGATFDKVYIDHVISGTELAVANVGEKGEFNVEFKIDKSDFYRLRFTDEVYVLLVPEINENIILKLDVAAIYKPEIKGSIGSELIYSAFGELDKYAERLEKIQKQIEDEKQLYLRELISKNSNSLSALFFVDQLNVENDFELMNKVASDLGTKYSDNSLVLELKAKIEAGNFLRPGTSTPEIILSSPDGKEIKLSSLKGKYVLIDFWASWCGPCKADMPMLVEIYNTYKSKGFEIYGVSLDQERNSWISCIETDKMTWTQVSDLKYWDSQVVNDYRIEGIPYTVLIDPKGNVIQVGLRGEELKAKLEAIFK